jgi:DNA-binding LytR/AlgR family response regulator
VPTQARFALHLSRDRYRLVDPGDVYWLEAEGEATLVRLRSRVRLRDARPLGHVLARLPPGLFFRIHRNHAVNPARLRELRPRKGASGWEVVLDPPVNRVLPVGGTALAGLRRLLRV